MQAPLTKPPLWYWIFSALALIWYGLSVFQYLGQAYNTENFRDRYTLEQLEMMTNAPIWAIVAFAAAAFFGLLGSIALIFRKKWAFPVFIVSFLGVVLEMYYNFYVLGSIALYGSSAPMIITLIIIFALTFLIVSKFAIQKKWVT